MQHAFLIRPDSTHTDPRILRGMFRLRHRVFRETLQWDVSSENGLERDRFDDLQPVYNLTCDGWQRVSGTMRLLPTTGPTMLGEIFPQLLRGEAMPCQPQTWEISRFAVAPPEGRATAQANISGETLALLRKAAEFGRDNGIRDYVFVTSVAVERLLRRLGLPVQRFGDGQAQRIGRVLSVACWLPVNEAVCKTLGLAAQPADKQAAA